jgi:hypothetical protein
MRTSAEPILAEIKDFNGRLEISSCRLWPFQAPQEVLKARVLAQTQCLRTLIMNPDLK